MAGFPIALEESQYVGSKYLINRLEKSKRDGLSVRAYQIHASAPSNCAMTSGGYDMKSSKTTACTLELALVSSVNSGESRLEMTTIEVIDGCDNASLRIPLPIKPVEPVRMTFMIANCEN